MCIIVYKPAGKEIPSRDTLEKCFDYNNDGAGFMYPADDKVQIVKGFFTFDKFYDSLIDSVNKEMPVVMHFRISTAGKVNVYNCHPFPITEDRKLFSHNVLACDAGFAHNGIFSGLGDTKMSDTIEFVLKILAPCEKFIGHKGFDNLLNYAIEGSKLIILYKNGDIKPYGKWIEDDGIFYSNSTYLTSFRVYRNGAWSGGGYGYDDDEDYGYGSYESYKEKLAKNTSKYSSSKKKCPRCGAEITDDVEDFYGFCFECLFHYGYDPSVYQEQFDCSECEGLLFLDPYDDSIEEEDCLCADCKLLKRNEINDTIPENSYYACITCGQLLQSTYEKQKGECCDCMNIYPKVMV